MVQASQTPRVQFTPESARSFTHTSIASAMMVALAKQGCGCQAYSDVFTFNRWKAQGFAVKRGEKSITLPLWKDVETEDAETGETNFRKVYGSSHVFCRCQVEKTPARDPFQFRGKSVVKRENTPAWPCGCKPYTDILTAGRWNMLGRKIAKGESAQHRAGLRTNCPVFCRCQLVDGDTAPAFVEGEEVPF